MIEKYKKHFIIFYLLIGFVSFFTITVNATESINNDNFEITELNVENNQLLIKWKNLEENQYLKFYLECQHFFTCINNKNIKTNYIDYKLMCNSGCENYNIKIKHLNKDTDKEINYDEYICRNHIHSFEKSLIKKSQKDINGLILYKCKNCDVFKYIELKKTKDLNLLVKTKLDTSIISWNSDENLDGYEIWRKVGNKEYEKYIVTSGNKISIKNSNISTVYKVRGYIRCNNENIVSTYYSKFIKVNKPKIILRIDNKKINGYNYKMLTYNKVKLKWNKIKNIDGYKIYKYDFQEQKYKLFKTIDKNKTTLKITGLKPNKIYYFKIKAYNDSNEIISEKLKIKTLDKTTGYFYDRIVWNEIWSGILITDKKVSSKTMSNYRVNGDKISIKYNFSKKDKTLYIHTYLKFKGPGVNDKLQYYEWYWGKHQKTNKTSKTTYKQLIKEGVKEYWGINIIGNKYDFIPGCNFKVKIITHDQNLKKDQKYIEINVGTNQCYLSINNGYWPYVYNCVSNRSDRGSQYLYNKKIQFFMPTNQQLSKNKYGIFRPFRNVNELKNSVAHEFGHIFGLDDSYGFKLNNTYFLRLTETSEVGYDNIMKSSKNSLVNQNDIEMILQAQGEAIKNKPGSFQAYKTIKNPNFSYNYQKSNVIRK